MSVICAFPLLADAAAIGCAFIHGALLVARGQEYEPVAWRLFQVMRSSLLQRRRVKSAWLKAVRGLKGS